MSSIAILGECHSDDDDNGDDDDDDDDFEFHPDVKLDALSPFEIAGSA